MFKKLQVRPWAAYLAIAVLPVAVGCRASESPAPSESIEADAAAGLRDALLFHAGFDDGWDAGFAKGDSRLYTAPSYKEQDKATPGIGNPEVEIVSDAGGFSGCSEVQPEESARIFYRAENNVSYSESSWNGTIAFWLSLGSGQRSCAGFCDPIQITDAAYNDAAIWVDFTPENPRQFRLGVFGDLDAWNPENIPQDENPNFGNRVVVVDPPPSHAENGPMSSSLTRLGRRPGRGGSPVPGRPSAGSEDRHCRTIHVGCDQGRDPARRQLRRSLR